MPRKKKTEVIVEEPVVEEKIEEPTMMMLDPKEEMRRWIDNASFDELQHKFRTASSDDPMLSGSMAIYFERVMNLKRITTQAEAEFLAKMEMK